jgi:hypothetical protein
MDIINLIMVFRNDIMESKIGFRRGKRMDADNVSGRLNCVHHANCICLVIAEEVIDDRDRYAFKIMDQE